MTKALSKRRANVFKIHVLTARRQLDVWSTSARHLLAFIQLARRAMVISMLIRRAGGLQLEGLITRDQLWAKPRPTFEPGAGFHQTCLMCDRVNGVLQCSESWSQLFKWRIGLVVPDERSYATTVGIWVDDCLWTSEPSLYITNIITTTQDNSNFHTFWVGKSSTSLSGGARSPVSGDR